MSGIFVIVPTMNRPKSLSTALKSIATQTIVPKCVLVISDCDREHEQRTREVVEAYKERIKIELIVNGRTKNLPGALNSGLFYLIEKGEDPELNYIAVLDDDDEWEADYLESCYNKAEESKVDFVVSGIVRHESHDKDGVELSIPESLTIHDLLVGNPHLQGSNLFVKFSALLMAGGFDEFLDSITDRDVYIRLLDIGAVFGVVKKYLVHHWALSDIMRLSTPGSKRKCNGLNAFYWKYSPRMNDVERIEFKDRAIKLFACKINENFLSEKLQTKSPNSPEFKMDVHSRTVPLIVGIMATRLDSIKSLLDDLVELCNRYRENGSNIIRSTLVLDHVKSVDELNCVLNNCKYGSLHIRLITAKELEEKCDRGDFGIYYEPQANRHGISAGRAMLHHYLYEEAKSVPGAAVWILDDDVRLEYLTTGKKQVKIEMADLQNVIIKLKQKGVSIANGRITGDPPVPGLSTLRTQLLDLFYNINRTADNEDKLIKDTELLIAAYPDYYYDNSELHYAHLEVPLWHCSNEIEELIMQTPSMGYGRDIFRPVVNTPYFPQNSDGVVPRGGNTLVLNIECLRLFPNISPTMEEIVARRGDTFWCMLNSYIGGYTVSSFPIAVMQQRTHEVTGALDLKALVSDVYGSSLIKAMDQFYRGKIAQQGKLPRRVRLSLDEDDALLIISLFDANLKRRLAQFIMNSYRIRGLITSIIKTPSWNIHASAQAQKFLNDLEQVFSQKNIDHFTKDTKSYPGDDLKAFLKNFSTNVKSYRHSLDNEPRKQHIDYAKMLLERVIDSRNLLYIGHGLEGAVFTDNKFAYKFFFAGKAGFQEGQLDFIQKRIMDNPALKHMAKLSRIIEFDGELIFVMDYVKGAEYHGGYLSDFMELLREFKEADIVTSNFYPKNIFIANDSIKFMDIGNSLFPLNEREFLSMCKRAFITYRWHFRNDLRTGKLMERALFEDNLPEMYGFQYFLSAIDIKTKRELLNPRIIELVQIGSPKAILDYGCGRGSISEALACMGFDIIGYEVDERILQKNCTNSHGARYIGKDELAKMLVLGKKFDRVVCSLVLCTIEDDAEVEQVVSNIRMLISDKGEVIITFCNPFYTFTKESESHIKLDIPGDAKYGDKFIYHKRMKEKGTIRTEVHRPFEFYKNLFQRHGFDIIETIEVPTTDIVNLCPSSDFIILRLKPLRSNEKNVSLLIKACAMEWQTIDFQVRHIVGQLEGPVSFKERVVIADIHEGSYTRQYCKPNPGELIKRLNHLVEEHIIDKVIIAPMDKATVSETYKRWFNIESVNTHTAAGQPTFMTLYSIDQCSGEYVLQIDSDCLFVRLDRSHDYLADMIEIFNHDLQTLSVSFNIAHKEDQPYTKNKNGKWRIEVRCCLFKKDRLEKALPMPNGVDDEGFLKLSWYRSMDEHLKDTQWQSYRGGDKRTFFIHVPNERKKDVNGWYNIIQAIERLNIPDIQYESVDLKGSITDWLGLRSEPFIFIIRGQNVPVAKLRRSLLSLYAQDSNEWGAIIIDAGSSNPMADYIKNIVRREIGDKVTIFYNIEALTSMENNKIAISELCSNPESVIITLDADDALIGNNVIDIISRAYDDGADLTVGSMVRTDKHIDYPIDFDDPRNNRGGNVWQHLRTFKKRLFDQIPEDYFKINGEWIWYAEDWAFMLPMVELSKKPVHIREKLYFYEPTGKTKEGIRTIRESIIGSIIAKKTIKSGCNND